MPKADDTCARCGIAHRDRIGKPCHDERGRTTYIERMPVRNKPYYHVWTKR